MLEARSRGRVTCARYVLNSSMSVKVEPPPTGGGMRYDEWRLEALRVVDFDLA